MNDEIRSRLDAVIHGERIERVPELVKAILIDSMQCGSLAVPASFRSPIEGTYARRLLHRDPDGKYTMVVMTWGPGQTTALHDHAGIWCVECVVDGRMEVAQFDLQSEEDGRYRFAERNRVVAARGSAGCLWSARCSGIRHVRRSRSRGCIRYLVGDRTYEQYTRNARYGPGFSVGCRRGGAGRRSHRLAATVAKPRLSGHAGLAVRAGTMTEARTAGTTEVSRCRGTAPRAGSGRGFSHETRSVNGFGQSVNGKQ